MITVSLRRSDLIKAWRTGCPDVRTALERLYPDTLPPEVQEKDVTKELGAFLKHSYDGTACIKLIHHGEVIGSVKNYAIKIEHDDYYMKDAAMSYYFTIIKKQTKEARND